MLKDLSRPGLAVDDGMFRDDAAIEDFMSPSLPPTPLVVPVYTQPPAGPPQPVLIHSQVQAEAATHNEHHEHRLRASSPTYNKLVAQRPGELRRAP